MGGTRTRPGSDASRAAGPRTVAHAEARSRRAVVAGRIGAWLLSAPLSVSFALLLLMAPVLPVGPVRVSSVVAHPTVLLGSMVWAPGPVLWLLGVLGVLALGPLAERHLGALRFAGISVAGHVVSMMAMAELARLALRLDPAWGAVLSQGAAGGPWPGLLAALAISSTTWPTLWRRRLWILVPTLAGTAAAFSGSPQDTAVFLAVAGGVGLAWALTRRRRRAGSRRRAGGTREERRLLVAMAVGGVVVGTVVALGAPHLVGPLSGTRLLFASAGITPEGVAAVCADAHRLRECTRQTYVLRAAGPGQVILAALPLLLQLVLADGLRRGRRTALVGTLALQGLLAALAAAHLLAVAATVQEAGARPQDATLVGRLVLPVLVPLALLAFVAVNARLFSVRTPRGTHRRAVLGVAAGAAVVVLVVVAAGLAAPEQFSPDPDPGALLTTGLLALLPSTALTVFTPAVLPDGPVAEAVLVWLPILPWAAAVVVLGRLLRAPAERHRHREDWRHAVRRRATAEATLAWMGGWPHNQVWCAEQRDAVIAYRDHRGVALTVGDPVCAPEDLPAVLAEFAEFCSRQSLVPALYSVHASATAAAEALGWRSVQVAEETLLPLGEVTFAGKRFQDVRTAVNRAAKEGVRAEWTTWGRAPLPVREQIREISEAWVSDRALPEMGFTLGGMAELDDPAVELLLAVDEAGVLHGVTSWLPVFDGGERVGLTLDFMRRREGGFRPVIEFLLARAALDAQARGLRVLSLSGAPLARTDVHDDAAPGALDRLLDALGALLEPVYGFRSLHAFKAKFGPQYRPMHLCVPDLAHLPAVGAALAEAYVPGLGPVDLLRTAQALRRSGSAAPAGRAH